MIRWWSNTYNARSVHNSSRGSTAYQARVVSLSRNVNIHTRVSTNATVKSPPPRVAGHLVKQDTLTKIHPVSLSHASIDVEFIYC